MSESHVDRDAVGQVGGRAALPIAVVAPALDCPVGLQRTHVALAACDGHHVAGCGWYSWDVGCIAPTDCGVCVCVCVCVCAASTSKQTHRYAQTRACWRELRMCVRARARGPQRSRLPHFTPTRTGAEAPTNSPAEGAIRPQSTGGEVGDTDVHRRAHVRRHRG